MKITINDHFGDTAEIETIVTINDEGMKSKAVTFECNAKMYLDLNELEDLIEALQKAREDMIS